MTLFLIIVDNFDSSCYTHAYIIVWGCVYVPCCHRKLYKWRESKRRKPLIIEGARQVGKTWLMKEFGSKAYANTVYINFDSTPEWQSCSHQTWTLTVSSWDWSFMPVTRSKRKYAAHFWRGAGGAESAFSLKYFWERTTISHRLRGFAVGHCSPRGTSFPVGKVDFLKPLSAVFPRIPDGDRNERFCRVAGQAGLCDDNLL